MFRPVRYSLAMVETHPDRPRKGRGALANPTGRFEPHARVAVDDGWGGEDGDEDDAPPPLRTTVGTDASRTVIARNASPDVPFDRSINPYRGCEHGCVYCFARPTHAFLGLSPGLDFETKLFAKPNAARLLEAELARPSYRPEVIALGTNTDPYQPIERRLGITRRILEALWRARHPVAIVTKSHLVERDLDILAPMAAARLVRVMVSVTTLKPALARTMEPRAPRPALRLAAVRGLAEAGVPVGVLAAPMIPALNDEELEAILAAAAEAGATSAGYVLLRLPLEIKDLFGEWLEAHFPERKARVLNLVRQTRGGKLYDSAWFTRQRGRGPYAELLERRFALACRRLGLNRNVWELDITRFRRPHGPAEQLALF
ncbi:MAG: PA0069 family radical SAM protein [Kiloniellaceae bacterium]